MYSILIFGDSITAGRCAEKNKIWVSRLVQFFDKKDKDSIIVYNLGVAGESSKELLKRFDIESRARTIRKSPDDTFLIIIAIGINDSKGINSPDNFNTPKQIFYKNIQKLIKIAKNYTDKLIFVGPTPVDENKTILFDDVYFLNKNIKKYNKDIKIICKNKKVTFVDILKDWSNKNYRNFLTADGVHSNELGHKKIFEKIIPLIK